jgi:HSP20 family protein
METAITEGELMANQETTTREQQQTKSSQGGELARSQRQAGTQTYNPLGLSLTPLELLGLNPFMLMRRMTEDIERTLGSSGQNAGADSRAIWAPAMEVLEREGALIVRAELPGLKPEEVKVEVRDGALLIEGERKQEIEKDEAGFHRTERRYGRFSRIIALPDTADAEKAEARFENGVLEVTVPVSRPSHKQIPIRSGAAGSSSQSGAAGGSAQSGAAGSSSSGGSRQG